MTTSVLLVEVNTALEKLSESLALAERGGLIRNFVDLGPDMAHLLRELAASNLSDCVAPEYIVQILSAFVASPLPEAADQSNLIEPLTDREFDVLALLRDRLSYGECARQLTVSPNTIKKHAINIYQKLGVHGRRDAINRAEALGILPSTQISPAPGNDSIRPNTVATIAEMMRLNGYSTRNALAVSWPAGIKASGEICDQWHHVVDIVPTILEAAGLPQPYLVNGAAQKPIEGVSMAYTFDDPDAESQQTTQYFEIFGNRGIYQDGWTAVTHHSTPWLNREWPSFEEDDWELYDTNKDWSQAHDLSEEMPDKLREMQYLFMIEAAKYGVFPLGDRRYERF